MSQGACNQKCLLQIHVCIRTWDVAAMPTAVKSVFATSNNANELLYWSHPDVFSLSIPRVSSVKTQLFYCLLKWRHVSTQGVIIRPITEPYMKHIKETRGYILIYIIL